MTTSRAIGTCHCGRPGLFRAGPDRVVCVAHVHEAEDYAYQQSHDRLDAEDRAREAASPKKRRTR
jgi:hypothetical protein